MIADVEPSVIAISIHALRVEGDDEEYINQICDYNISIHALRVEGDERQRKQDGHVHDFYPRPPGGGRHSLSFFKGCHSLFLSTPSGWRATAGRLQQGKNRKRFLSTPSGWRATSG